MLCQTTKEVLELTAYRVLYEVFLIHWLYGGKVYLREKGVFCIDSECPILSNSGIDSMFVEYGQVDLIQIRSCKLQLQLFNKHY